MTVRAVLFDLDGTLLDTAPDICSAINTTLEYFGYRPVTLQTVSAGISHGAAGIFSRVLNTDSKTHEKLANHFLETYQHSNFPKTRLFNGISNILKFLAQSTIPWGVVTNKSHRFTVPLLQKMKLHESASCIISGDSTNHRKPHPAPVLLACQQLEITPQQVLFVGDHEKDITAGHAAGTCTAFAKYGYIDPSEDRVKFSTAASHTIDHPMQLANIIKQINQPRENTD